MADLETRGPFAAMGELMQEIRAAEDDLRAEQDAALRRYVERVDAILAFGVPFEDHPDDDDHNPTHVLDALRALLDDLRVQTHLGFMDGEDLMQRVRTAVRRITT
jgi:hypothetical protein